MAKSLFDFTFFFFSFLFLFGLTIQGKSVEKCHMIMSHVKMSQDKYRKVVHRPYSSCISSVQNQIGTLLSSLCQLRLER